MRRLKITYILFLMALLLSRHVLADDIRVLTNVESRDVYAGESFLMQISVDGANSAREPDFSGVEGFIIEYMGGSNNSSQSISIINGRVQRTVKKGFVFTYKLTPKSPGRYVIPAMDVDVEGTVFKTTPITISVKKPEESEDFKLRINISRETCFVGEPVLLTVVWYLNRDVEAFNFTAPILENEAFDFETPEVKIDPAKKYFRVPLAGGEVIAEKGRGILDGARFVTLSFKIAVIPRRAGTFVIPEFIVACESGTGIRNRRDFFDDFFTDNYRGNWRGSLKKYVVPSNRLSLGVNELPLEGRPPGFAGHVGALKIEASAEPTDVNVGDPITLKLTVEGPDYLGRFDLPSLSTQPGIEDDFKVPEERADGRIEGQKKIFTQTLRAKHDGVTGIPAVELAYFDTEKQKYEIARSEPVPLNVRPTRVVTAGDAEGIESGPAGSPLEKWKEGIAYNYEGTGVLRSHDAEIGTIFKDSRLLSLFLSGPFVFVILLAGRIVVSRRDSDPESKRSRMAAKKLSKNLSSIEATNAQQFSEEVLEAFKEYLGDKLGRSGAALAAGETPRLLEERGTDPETVGLISGIFEECEHGVYAGGLETEQNRENLVSRMLDAARRLDRQI